MIPLTVRSHYSLQWGAISPRKLAFGARQMGYERLALTDTDNLCGLWEFLPACEDAGIKPIVGAEITDPDSSDRAVCLVENQEGFRNLCRIITRRKTDEGFRLETDLPPLGGGLVILVKSAKLLAAWHEAGVNVAAAMPRTALSQTRPLYLEAKRRGLPIAATTGSFFLTPEDFSLHRLIRAISLNSTLSRLTPKDTAPIDSWLAPPSEYSHRFSVCPETMAATFAISERLTFTRPEFSWTMPPWEDNNRQDAKETLRREAFLGAVKRYQGELSENVVDRLEHELSIIEKMGFSSYFLVVKDIVTKSPRTCGRGSGAASLVSYCLGITNVCPVKHNLYFERFLNLGRKDPPDIDVDFAWDERDDVISSVLSRYKGKSAMVSSHVLFQPRMAIRETAKVYGIPEGEFGRWVKRMGRMGWDDDPEGDLLADAVKLAGKLDPPWPEILNFARRLVGVPRCLSVHPGGIVITPGPIEDYAPVEIAPKGVPILQWEKDGTEDAGLVKIDLLGNRSLAVIRDAIASLKENGQSLDESAWEPEDDFATQEAVADGRTMGCFYIESPAMRLLQKKAQVGDFEHLVIHSSIIRPAANDCINEYLRRLHGGEWEHLHPALSDVLSEAYGIMVYQEDVSRAATALAGFTPAEAETLRKVLSRKDKDRALKDFKERFATGAADRGVAPETVEAVWAMMMSFSGYSFCKPHSASYARVSFQAAWLKVHYPAEFMAAVISNGGGFYGPFAYVSEARRMGLSVLPPSVAQSLAKWTGNGKEMRVGLSAIKDLGCETVRRIVDERQTRRFSGVDDFLRRIRPDERETRALISSGALDDLEPGANRAMLVWKTARPAKAKSGRYAGDSLFGDSRSNIACPPLPPEDEIERLRREFSVLSFLCDRHPMALFADNPQVLRAVKARDISLHSGRRVTLAGWLVTGKTVATKHGEPMKFLTFEDETDIFETVFFPRAFERFFPILDYGRPYLVTGHVDESFGAYTLNVNFLRGLC